MDSANNLNMPGRAPQTPGEPAALPAPGQAWTPVLDCEDQQVALRREYGLFWFFFPPEIVNIIFIIRKDHKYLHERKMIKYIQNSQPFSPRTLVAHQC